MPDPVSEETARNRWLAIVLSRVAGAALVVVGLLIMQRAIAAPEALGTVLVLVGFAATFLVPVRLARRWRSPPE